MATKKERTLLHRQPETSTQTTTFAFCFDTKKQTFPKAQHELKRQSFVLSRLRMCLRWRLSYAIIRKGTHEGHTVTIPTRFLTVHKPLCFLARRTPQKPDNPEILPNPSGSSGGKSAAVYVPSWFSDHLSLPGSCRE